MTPLIRSCVSRDPDARKHYQRIQSELCIIKRNTGAWTWLKCFISHPHQKSLVTQLEHSICPNLFSEANNAGNAFGKLQMGFNTAHHSCLMPGAMECPGYACPVNSFSHLSCESLQKELSLTFWLYL